MQFLEKMRLTQVDMDVIVADVFLACIRGINVSFSVCGEIAPYNTANVREFSSPNRRSAVTNTGIRRFQVEHILSDNAKGVIGVVHQTAFGATAFLLQKVVIRAVGVR